ncbi:hypothetical protein Syun_002081 [Stephania yunnanensis]|uniref:Uncharacterized protein n=1 Tax=Stephania yunnanensis TaxID=152371 RepID=A0AAP0LF51_9MAGN
MASNAVQIVNKASSDELLKKFAELDEGDDPSPRRSSSSNARDALRVMVMKRQRRSLIRVIGSLDDCGGNGESISRSWKSSSSSGGGCNSRALADQKKCLISRSGASGRRSSPAMLRRLGLIKAGEFKNKSLFRTIEKAWRKTVEGASKMFIERHYFYDRHNRLISDVV